MSQSAQLDRLATAVTDIGRATRDMSEKLEDQLREEREARERLEANVTEIGELAKATGRGMGTGQYADVSGPPLTRIDPGYHDPARGRTMPNALAATAMGHFMHAIIAKSTRSRDWLADHDIELKRVEEMQERAGEIHDDELGGYTLPPEFGGIIIGALPSYGTFPQYAEPEIMTAPKKTFAKDGTDVQVYAIEEGETIPEVDPSYSQITLEAKLFGAFTRWSVDYEQYGLAGVGERWIERFSRAIAKKMDQCGFLGDGSSGYNNIVGMFNNANVTLQSLGSGDTDFGDMDYDDIVNLMAAIPDEVYAEGNCRFFMSNNMLWLLAKLKDGDGRPMLASPTEGITRSILGEPIANSAVFPRLSDSAAGTKFMAFGDLRRAFKMGIRTRISVLFSPHAYFRQGQNSLRVLTRFGIAAAYPSALAVLKTADA